MKKTNIVLVAALIILSSCSTLKVTLVSPNSIQQDNVKKIAIVPVAFAERQLAVFPLIDAAMYNKGIKATADQQTLIMTKSAEDANTFYKDAISQKSGKEVVLSGTKPETITADMFTKPEAAEFVRKVAEETGSDMVVTIVSQVQTLGVGAFGIKGNNILASTMYLFDKNGATGGIASFTSEAVTTGSKNMEVFKQICNENLKQGNKLVDILF